MLRSSHQGRSLITRRDAAPRPTRRVTVEFIEQGRQTKVVLTQERFPDPSIVRIVSTGTLESLDQLKHPLLAQAA